METAAQVVERTLLSAALLSAAFDCALEFAQTRPHAPQGKGAARNRAPRRAPTESPVFATANLHLRSPRLLLLYPHPPQVA